MSQSKKILVVDDDAVLRAGLQTMLTKHGYEALEAEDGIDARELIDGQHPDLVILDMMMPRWGGFAVLEHFKSRPDAPPFIMITANESAKNQAYAEQIGVIDFLRKPFSLERLLERVETAIGKPTPDEPAPPAAPEPRAIRISCPACAARIKAPLQLLGQKRECPRCARVFVVKRESPRDEGPRLIMDLDRPH